MKARLLIPILILAATRFASGWSDDGHELVAQIAYDRLSPAKQQKLDTIIAGLSSGRIPYNAVSAACWADDTKTDSTRNWHFIDLPVGPGPAAPSPNVVTAIDGKIALFKTLSETPANRVKRAQTVAFLIHLVGDIHQPLHAAEHSSDHGGGGVTIANAAPASNLHHFWDGAYGVSTQHGKVVVPRNSPRPTSAGNTTFRPRAQAIVASSAPGIYWNHLGNDHAAWADESHKFAVNFAYGKLQPSGNDSNPATLNAAYVTGAKALANQRIALAGYRLAALLDSLL